MARLLLQAGEISFGTIRAGQEYVLTWSVSRSRMMVATIPPQHSAPLLDHPVVRLAQRLQRVQATDLLDRKKRNPGACNGRKSATHQAFSVFCGGVARLIRERIQDGG